jgi:hypothetical protein
MHLRKRLTGMLALAALGAVVIVPLSASPASAATCYGASCNDKNPYDYGCVSDAVTIYTVNHVGTWGTGILQLRYSPSCGAAWAKIVDDGTANTDWIYVQNTLGNFESQGVNFSTGDAFTFMVNDAGYIESQACVGNSGGCTSWW